MTSWHPILLANRLIWLAPFIEVTWLLTKLSILNTPVNFNCHFLKEFASVYWLRSFRKIALSNKSPSAIIRSLTKGYSFNYFGLLIMTFGSSPTDILTNVLILKRFANNILSRFTYPGKRGGREPILLLKEGWTLPKEG